jgi:hypothetical protein
VAYVSRTHTLPASAVVGSNAQRQSAYTALTAAQQQSVNSRVTPYLTSAIQTAQQNNGTSVSGQDSLLHTPNVDGRFVRALSPIIAQETALALTSDAGSQMTVPLYPGSVNAASKQGINLPPGFRWAKGSQKPKTRLASYRAGRASRTPRAAQAGGTDLDNDGLPDAFENQLGDAFTPFYHVSTGETDNFATFLNSVPETVNQRLGPHPLSYFRVKPLGFVFDNTGRQYGAIQINYLTLWDHDSGLQIGGLCDTFLGIASGITGIGLANLVTILSSHNLDDEHSAALLLAPTPSPSTYDTTVTDYFGYSYYTAAHEGTFFDESAYLNPNTPIPAGWHLNIWLSLAKHSSYTFNPDSFPLIPVWLMFAYYDTLDALYADGIIDDLEYFYLLYVGDTLFFACIIEHFGEQGGVYATPRINVGEPIAGDILNNAGFIMDTNHAYPKLTEKIWLVPTPGTGSATVNGTLQSIPPGAATPGTGTATIAGVDRFVYVAPPGCHLKSCSTQVWDSGTVSLTVNGMTKSASYARGSTGTTIATALANAFTADSTATVTMTASTNVLTIRSKATGAATNYAMSSTTRYDSTDFPTPSFTAALSGATLTGGGNGSTTTTYDTGNVWVTVNGFQANASYGQGSTATSIASAIAGVFNASSSSPVVATLSGSKLNLVAKQSGANTNYPLSTGATTSQPSLFAQPSFSVALSGSTLTGGSNAASLWSTPRFFNVEHHPGQQPAIINRRRLKIVRI